MRLDAEGRDFIRFAFKTDATDLTEVEVGIAGQWHEATIEPPEDPANWTGDAVVLCAGPDAPVLADPPVEVAVLPRGVHRARVRVRDNPTIVVRGGGYIVVE